jgi:hypothetical protein
MKRLLIFTEGGRRFLSSEQKFLASFLGVGFLFGFTVQRQLELPMKIRGAH